MTDKPFDPTKPYCRRDELPAFIVYTWSHNGNHLVVSGDDYYRVKKDGKEYYEDASYSARDLVNIPEKIEGLMYVYKIAGGYVGGNVFNKNKDKSELSTAVACIKVSFTEGEGLNEIL